MNEDKIILNPTFKQEGWGFLFIAIFAGVLIYGAYTPSGDDSFSLSVYFVSVMLLVWLPIVLSNHVHVYKDRIMFRHTFFPLIKYAFKIKELKETK